MRERRLIEIGRQDYLPFLLDIHYARRVPSISRAFGLQVDGELEGVVTFGTPPSATLRRGVCGPEFQDHVVELNRLCLLHNERNDASWLVAASIRHMNQDRRVSQDVIYVSFADTAQGHSGVVYKACNFIYCGLSAKRTDWKVRGKEHLHGQTIADEFRGQPNRAALMREKYGDNFYLEPRSRKHRYILIAGSRKFRKAATAALRYKTEDYP